MDNFTHDELPQQLLDLADDITLGELLETPSCQAFIVSTLQNILQNSHRWSSESRPEDYVVEGKLNAVMNQVPRELRNKKFRQANTMVRLSKEARDDRALSL